MLVGFEIELRGKLIEIEIEVECKLRQELRSNLRVCWFELRSNVWYFNW